MSAVQPTAPLATHRHQPIDLRPREVDREDDDEGDQAHKHKEEHAWWWRERVWTGMGIARHQFCCILLAASGTLFLDPKMCAPGPLQTNSPAPILFAPIWRMFMYMAASTPPQRMTSA